MSWIWIEMKNTNLEFKICWKIMAHNKTHFQHIFDNDFIDYHKNYLANSLARTKE